MKTIRTYEVASDIFDRILQDFPARIKICPEARNMLTGYSPRQEFRTDGFEYMIIPEYILQYYNKCIDDCTEWKQIRIRRVENTNNEVILTTNGTYAWNVIKNILLKVYTEQEIEDRLNMFEREYDPEKKQFHYVYPADANTLNIFENCYEYDINGAHADALITIFPKATDGILKLYKERKIKPINKAYINYAVGYLCRIGHRKTYNWIVQRTTDKLLQAISYTGGQLIYANTDGYIISCPENTLLTSTELGDYKLETSGTVYLYTDRNYYLIQTDKEMKGSCLRSVRKYINLPEGKVVHYRRKRVSIGKDANGKEFYVNIAEDVQEETL